MDKVSRGIAVLLPILLLFSLSAKAAAPEDEAKAMVERSNQRCDDFFRYRRELEQMDARREKGSQEIKKVRAAHDAALEAARKEYVKNRKKSVPDPRLEKEYDEQAKGWIEANKLAGKRYAERKAQVEAITRKGCRVPEMKEYDLED